MTPGNGSRWRWVTANDDRENLFVEVYFEDEEWAEVIFNDELGAFEVTLWAPERGNRYVMPLDEALEALAEARRRLVRRGYGANDRAF